MENQTANTHKRVHSIKEIAPAILVTIVLFVVCLAFGLISPPYQSSEVFAGMAKTLQPLTSLGHFGLFVVIFLNNAIKTLIALLLGIALGLPALIFICFNGYIIGLLVSAVGPTTSPLIILASIAPHGIIEIPVLLLSSAMGIAIGFESLKWLFKRESSVKSRLRWCLGIYLKWMLAALVIAALIEVFVTPLLIHLVGGGEIPIGIN
jgi:stage II sporulation protein M